MVNTLFLVRHAEREDNVTKNWERTANPFGLRSDNTPLSARGHKQCEELFNRFANVPIDHIFASPFDRTIDTATRLICSRTGLPIKAEPGLCEVLYLCEKPPGFEDPATLKKRYPLVDLGYKPLYTKGNLPKESYGDEECIPRVKKTIEHIEREYKEADTVLLVSHASIVAAAQQTLVGKWAYVGQATVSKYVRDGHDRKWRAEMVGDTSHMADPTNLRAY